MATLHEIQLADGTTLKTALPPERLAEIGLPARPLGTGLLDPGSQALAFGDSPQGSGGTGNVPDVAPRRFDGQGGASSTQDQGGGTGAPASDIQRAPEPEAATGGVSVGEQKPRGVSRFGAETKSIEAPQDMAPQSFAPPRPQYRTIRAADTKGADIRTGYKTEKSAATDLLPEHEEQASNARINMGLAAQEHADVKADALERERGMAVEEEIRRQEAERQIRERQAAMQRAQADYTQRQTALDQEHDEIQKLNVDPNRYWEGLGTGGKILAAIGMIAGGINSGLRGGPNQAAEFIYRAIRDDVANQREKIEARRQGLNTKQTQLDKKSALMRGDLELASRELEANGLALAAAIGKKHAAEAGIASVNPDLMAFLAKLEQEAANSRIDNAAKFGAKTAEQFSFVPDRTVVVGGAVAPKKPENMVRLPNGQYMFARDSTSARAAEQKIIANARLAQLANRAEVLTNEIGKRAPTAEEKARADTILSEMMFTYKDASQAGALDKGLQDAMGNYFGKATDLLRVEDVGAKLREVGGIAGGKVNEVVQYELHPDETYTSGVPMGGGGRRYEN